MLSILTGPAQSYAYYECTDADKTTWVTLYEALKRRFRNKYDGILARDKLESFRLQNSRQGYTRYLQKFREICSQCQPPISAYDQSRYFIRGLQEEYSKDLLLMNMHQFTAIAEQGLALHQAAWQAREFASGTRPPMQHPDMVMQNFQKNSGFRSSNFGTPRTLSRHQQRKPRWGVGRSRAPMPDLRILFEEEVTRPQSINSSGNQGLGSRASVTWKLLNRLQLPHRR